MHKLSYKTLFIIFFFLLISIVVLARFVLPNNKVKATWWNETWMYRKAVSITNNTNYDAINVPYKLNLDTQTLISNNKLQADADDIRIVDSEGKIVRYQVEKNTLNTSNTKIWFEATVKSNSASSYYIYYGNSSTSAQNFSSDINTITSNASSVTVEMKDGFGYTTSNSYGRISDIRKNGSNLGVDGNMHYSSSYPGNWWADISFNQTILNSTGPLFVEVKYSYSNRGSYSSFGSNLKIFDNGFSEVQLFTTYNTSGSEDFYYFLPFDTGTRNSVWVNGSGTLVDQDANSGSLTESSLGQNWFGQRWTASGIYGGTIITKNGSDWNNGSTSTRDSYYQTNYSYSTAFTSGSSREVRFGIFAGNGGLSEMQQKGANYGSLNSSLASEELSPAPIAYWKFDEGSGTTANDSTGNYNGTLTGTTLPAWQSENQCISGKCLFNPNGYISVNNLWKTFQNSSFSISSWVYFTDNSTSDRSIISIGSPGTDTQLHLVRRTNKIYFAFWGDDFTGDMILEPNIWYNVTVTWNSNTRQQNIYINGKLDKNRTSSGLLNVPNSSELLIGTYGGNSTNGFLDEVKIYPYARTADQIKQDYNSRGSSKGTSANFGSNKNNSISLIEGLVGYWKFDENIGTTVLDSSGNNNIAIFGVGDSAPAWSNGKFGTGTSFDGINDYINFGNPGLSSLTNTTISFWRKATNSNPWLLFKGQDGGYYIMATHGTDAFYHGNIGSATKIYIDGNLATTPLTDNNWHHYVITGANLSAWTNLTLSNYSSYQYNGSIDEVRLYNRALSPAEITQLYEYAPPPVAYWNFEENTGTTVNDKSGNGKNLTTYNSPIWNSGKFGSGIDFNGSNQYIRRNGDSSFNMTNGQAMTVSAWIYPRRLAGQYQDLVVNRSAAFYNWMLYQHITDGSVQLHGANQNKSTYIPPINQWTFISATVDSSGNYNLYANGVLVQNMTGFQYRPEFPSELSIGCFATLEYYSGKIDEVKIYNYARTQKQILEDMTGSGSVSKTPIAWWKFDEGSGTTASDSTSSRLVGSMLSSVSWASKNQCISNGCIYVNDAGTSAFTSVNVPDTPILSNLSQMTLSIWVKTISTKSTQQIIYKRQNGGVPSWWSFKFSLSSLRPSLIIVDTNGVSASITSSTAIETNKWYHLTGLYTGSELKLFINGKSAATPVSKTGIILDSDSQLLIGGLDSSSTNYFNGYLDDFKIYNYALSEDEIKQDYNSGNSTNFGVTSQTIGGTTTSLEYCIPGDSSSCAPPVAEWNFEENTGTTAKDISGNNNTGTFGSGNSAPTWTTGKNSSGAGLNFDGISDYLTTSSSSTLLNGDTSFTIQSWFKTNQLYNTGDPNVGGRLITLYRSTGSSKIGLGFYGNNTDTLMVFTNTSPISGIIKTNSSFNNNKWHHLSATYNSSTDILKLFYDGIEVGSTNVGTISSASSDNAIFGTVTGGNPFFKGLMDQARIYNYARTPAQIAYDYNKGAPVTWWKFDECQGNIANDSSGNNNNGTINIGTSGVQNSLGTCQIGTSAAWTAGASGKINSSLNFDGTDDYLSFTSTNIINPSQGAVSFWFKPSSIQNGTAYYMFSHPGSATNSRIYIYSSASGTAVRGVLGDGTQIGLVNVTANNWHHVIIMWNGTSAKFYVDGIDKTSTPTFNGLTTAVSSSSIGSFGGAQGYTGQIDDFRIYNYALTSEQVKQVYNGGAVSFN